MKDVQNYKTKGNKPNCSDYRIEAKYMGIILTISDVKQVGILGIKREYLKDKIYYLPTKVRKKNIRDLYRGINDFKRGYQPRINLVKDENGDLLQIPTFLIGGRNISVIECT
jgi:hypothetical protein